MSPEDKNKAYAAEAITHRAFQDYLHLMGIWHILAVLFHPQTDGDVVLQGSEAN